MKQEADKVAVVYAGEKVAVVEVYDEWVKVGYNGKEGYI